ncbi:MAG: hypothetical protein J1F39_05840 [Clostridiales bacterium]|nr:hypothetical protein [Clostridiales bacterium]
MAKKIVVEEDENGEVRPKKKRSKCCTCCIVFLIVILIILGAAFGVGWYFGDKYTQEYLDMPLSDIMSIVGELYWTNDKDVVTNPYGKSDLDKFYGEIKTNILLKEDADVDFDSALKNAIKSYLAESKSGQKAAVKNAGDGDAEGGDESSFLNIFIDMAAAAFTRENIDVEKLNAYSEENDNYIFNLNDKQLAAFVNSVLRVMLDETDSIEGLEEISKVVKLSDAVALKQIRFGTITKKDELGIDKITATTADVTLWLGLQDAAGAYVDNLVKNSEASWASGLAVFMTDLLLPKNLYITLSFPLYGEADTHVTINDMSTAKRDLTYKLINNVMKLSSDGDEEPQTVQSMLNGVTDQIKPFIESAASNMDMSSASKGTIKLDLLGSLAAMTGEDEESALTKPEFMYMLQALLGSDPDVRLEQLKPHLYDGWYTDGSNEFYKPDAAEDRFTKVNYSSALVEEMENKYALDFPVGENGEKSFDTILSLFGISLGEGEGGGSGDILSYLNAAKFHALLNEPNIDSLKLTITDRMLGAVLASQMDNLLGDIDVNFKLDAFTFVEKPDAPGHKYALIAVELDIGSMLDSMGDNMLGALAANIMPERMVLSVMVDYTRGVERNGAEFLFNDYTNTGKVISTLARLIPSFDVESMSETISDTVADMLDMLYDTLKVEPQTYNAAASRSAGIVLDDIFTVITEIAFKEDDGTTTVTPVEFKNILSGIYNPGEVAERNNVTDDSSYSGFINSIVTNYYLNSKEEIESFSQLTSFMSNLGSSFSGDKLLVTGSDPNKIYLAYDNRPASALKPTMDGEGIGALMKEKMPDNLTGFYIHNVETGDDKLLITIAIDIENLLPATVKDLLDGVTTLYVTADVNLASVISYGDKNGYDVNIKINDMDSYTQAALIKLATRYDSGFDIDGQVDEFGQVLYEQLGSLEDSVGNDLVSFTENGMEFPGFYDFLAKKMNLADEYTADDLKSALQGMYAKSDLFDNDNNYGDYFYTRNSGSLTLDPMFYVDGGTATDMEFNDFFDIIGDGLAGGQKGSSGINAAQTIILAKGDDPDIKTGDGGGSPVKLRDWVSDHVNVDGSVEELLLVTFKITVAQSFSGSDGSDGFLPEQIFVTAVFKLDNATGRFDEKTEFIYNDLTEAHYTMISHLWGFEPDGTVNINTVCSKAVENLNKLFDGDASITFGKNDTDKSGIGKIVYDKH